MKISVVCVGKIKERSIADACSEYLKRLRNIEIIEIKDSGKAEEGNSIARHIKPGSYTIALSEEGKAYSSVEFASLMKQISEQKSHLSFVIGGPDGISEEMKKHSDAILSLSKMTFTHEMCRLFLIEQVYRASMINADRKYHRT